jgi:LuxR family maltose regulon positive regulatory protein
VERVSQDHPDVDEFAGRPASTGSAAAGYTADQPETDGLPGDGTASDGLASDGLASDGLASDGLASDGLATDGLTTDGLTTDGLTTEGSATGGLTLDEPAIAGLATAGVTADGATAAQQAATAQATTTGPTASVEHTETTDPAKSARPTEPARPMEAAEPAGPAGPAEPAEPLLVSKLSLPPLPGGLVARPRLHDLLDAGSRGPLTVLIAPAGWGKTVLCGGWARGRQAIGWLTLEPDDADERFWWYLREALGSAGVPGPLPRPGTDGYLTELAGALSGLDSPATLILDDFHHIRDPEVLDGLEFLLRHAASGLRLIIASRADPSLPLQRLRLRDELTELRTGELSFTAEETAALLGEQELALPGPELDALQAHTEGWPAGVRFAALSLQGHPDPARFIGHFAGDDETVAEYLTGEVLEDLPPVIQQAMLETSILQRLCGGLVEAVTGRADGDQMLAELSRANTFVVPLGTRPSWYRYHRMFGELLRARLHRRSPERVADLHRRAARWHAGQDQPTDALRHALAARDWGYAAGLLVDNWHHLARYGHPEPLPTLVEPPPADAIRADPELALAYAADRLDLRDPDAAEGYLRLADQHRHLLDENRRDRFALIATALELAQAQQRGDAAQIRRAATGLLDLLGTSTSQLRPDPAGQSEPDASGAGAAAIALAALGTAELNAGDLDAAETTLRAGLARAEAAGLACPRLVCASTLAFVRAVRGELRAAQRTARAALAMPPCAGQSQPVHRGYAYLALAWVDLQRDRLDQARSELDFASGAGEPGAEPALAGSIAAVSAQLLHEQGELAKGYEVLSAGRHDQAERPPSRFLDHWFRVIEADLRTAHGDTETVRRMLAPAPDDQPAAAQPSAAQPSNARPGNARPSAAPPSAAQPSTAPPSAAPPSAAPPSAGQLAVARPPASARQPGGARQSTGPGPMAGAQSSSQAQSPVDATGPAPVRDAALAVTLAVTLAQAYLRDGDAGAALRTLPAWHDDTAAPLPLPLRLSAGLVEALAARHTGDSRRATRTLEYVLRLAEPEGFRRVFTRAGAAARELLIEHLDSGTACWSLVSELIAAGERPAPPAPGTPGPAALAEPLTERELTVLRYLQSILSNTEIAVEMSLSVNTVKTHVRNIYRKLDTARRRDAVRRARELHLL